MEHSHLVPSGGPVVAVDTVGNETYHLRWLVEAHTTVRPTSVTDGNPYTVVVDSL